MPFIRIAKVDESLNLFSTFFKKDKKKTFHILKKEKRGEENEGKFESSTQPATASRQQPTTETKRFS
ncbi:hypothetical protein JCM19047_3345 [Bacillus sp. JCM 19047]|nr:hypothetical protein JCM19047_3345 [Bacillus sp. JCM 19047]